MTKKDHQNILKIKRNFLGNLWKNIFGPSMPRRRGYFGTGGAPSPTKIDRRAADTMASAHGSNEFI